MDCGPIRRAEGSPEHAVAGYTASPVASQGAELGSTAPRISGDPFRSPKRKSTRSRPVRLALICRIVGGCSTVVTGGRIVARLLLTAMVPLAVQQRIDHQVGPPIMNEPTAAVVGFPAHTQSRRQASRCFVAGVHPRDHTVQP